MSGAFPVLVPGCGDVCVQAVCGICFPVLLILFFSFFLLFFPFIFFCPSFSQHQPSDLTQFAKDIFSLWRVAAELQAALLAQQAGSRFNHSAA